MAGWGGFTDADLRAIKSDDTDILGIKAGQRHSQAASRHGKPLSRRLQYQPNPAEPVPQDALLYKPLPKSATVGRTQVQEHRKENATGTGQAKVMMSISEENEGQTGASGDGSVEEGEKKAKMPATEDNDRIVIDEDEILSREIENLEVFRKHQKKIEDMNLKKKEALAAAIQKRQKQAKAETSRLTSIQKELSKLDQMVNSDISVIRDKIEDASREYMEAQKRYNKAEKEFIDAKVALFKKEEIKEDLTDHLYTIIHQNEVRKAKKLAELMEQLNIEDEETEQELSEIAHLELPSISVMNTVQTTKQQYLSHHSQSEETPKTDQAESCVSDTNEAQDKIKTENVNHSEDQASVEGKDGDQKSDLGENKAIPVENCASNKQEQKPEN